MQDTAVEVITRNLQWYGYVIRMDGTQLPVQAPYCYIPEKEAEVAKQMD